MTRMLKPAIAGTIAAFAAFSLTALAADPKPAAPAKDAKAAPAPAAEAKCEYKTCPNPSLQGGGLKDSAQAINPSEKTRGPYSSICQTPTFWCVIGPGPVGVPCYCNSPLGPVGGVTVH